MWPSKKLIIIPISAALLVAGITAGIVFAADNNNTQPNQGEDLLAKVCTIYAQKTGVTIDEATLKDAFNQAQNEIQLAREKSQLQNLVTQGKITQDQADQYLKWLQSRPNVPFGFGFGGFPGRGAPCAPPTPAPSTTQ